MNTIRFCSIIAGVLLMAVNAQAQRLWIVDPLEPIFPDSNQTERFSNTLHLDFPSGTVADVHVLLQIPLNRSFSVSARLSDKEDLSIDNWSNLVDVPVEENTGLDSRTEMYKGNINPFVIRRAPFRIYEAITPLPATAIESKNVYTALRLSIPAEKLKDRKDWSVKITAEGHGWKRSGTFKITVHDIALPALKDSRFFYTNWFNLGKMEKQYGLERWSDTWYTMLDKYAALMAHGRQNCINIPEELISLGNGKITLDENRLYRFIETFRKHGFTYFESPHLMNRGEDDNWGDPELKTVITQRRYYTAAAQKDIDTIVGLIKAFTTKYQLTNNWLQHISDEPTKVQAKCYRDIVAQVKSIYPEIKIMEATNDRDSLVGAVDYWCPLINDFQENEAFFRQREKSGEKILVYTCLIPGGPWLNRLLDQEKLRQVYFGWGASHYNTMGFLHWGLNQYHADPWKQTVVHHSAPGAAANNKLPAGDTHVIYPGEDGPCSSIRFESHRIGIEDYELLEILKTKKTDEAAALIRQVFTSYTQYNTSVKEYRQVRKKLLMLCE